MAENPMPIDEVEDYCFGRLTPADSRRFEARLARDAALQRHLRELEEGVLALALAAPPLRPPREAWTNIQAGLARERQPGLVSPVALLDWLLRGWPLAGGLAAALFIYLAVFHRSVPEQPAATAAAAGKQTAKPAPVTLPPGTQFAGPAYSNAAEPVATAKKAPRGSVASVRGRMFTPAGNQAWHEIDAVTVQEPEDSDDGRQPTRLRQAVALALTHRMGQTNLAEGTLPSSSQEKTPAKAPVQVDYVELPNPIAAAASGSPTLVYGDGTGWEVVGPIFLTSSSSGGVTMVASGNDLLVAIDATGLSANFGAVAIWGEDLDGNQIFFGTVNPGSNPMVINIQNAYVGMGYVYVVATNGANVLGYYLW